MKKAIKSEINEALNFIQSNDGYLEDWSSFLSTCSDREVKEIARAIENQFNVPCRTDKDGLDLRVQVKCHLFMGYVPVL